MAISEVRRKEFEHECLVDDLLERIGVPFPVEGMPVQRGYMEGYMVCYKGLLRLSTSELETLHALLDYEDAE